MSEMLTPDLEKEIISLQSQIRIADYPKKSKNDYFYVWTLGMGFILGVWMTILVRAL